MLKILRIGPRYRIERLNQPLRMEGASPGIDHASASAGDIPLPLSCTLQKSRGGIALLQIQNRDVVVRYLLQLVGIGFCSTDIDQAAARACAPTEDPPTDHPGGPPPPARLPVRGRSE